MKLPPIPRLGLPSAPEISLPLDPGSLRVLARSGLLGPSRPDRALRQALVLWRWGTSMAAVVKTASIRRPGTPAVIDDAGSLGYEELDRSTNAIANGLAERGVGEGQAIAILCRNGRGFVQTVVATSKLGCDMLLLNAEMAPPQLAALLERERPAAIVHGPDLGGAIKAARVDAVRIVAGEPAAGGGLSIQALADSAADFEPAPPAASGRTILLTSGTTGAPKGAHRSRPSGLSPLVTVLSAVPLEVGERILIAPPLFHAHGYSQLEIGLSLGATFLLPERFDPPRVLDLIERERATVLVAVPIMLRRLLEAQRAEPRDVSSLKAAPCSGSALPGELAEAFMDEFGEVLYNVYGSTETAWATIAGPADLRAAPGTAGRPPRGARLAILDESGAELPPGETGRIFVGNEMLFEGYTDGSGARPTVRGMMSAGDLGHLDARGRLFIDAREDDMIVSGGENVYPGEVEELLGAHPAVAEAAVVGVPDEEFGERLEAHVVLAAGAEAGEKELRDHVRAHLARYKVPRRIVFHQALPRNAIGKVLKTELRKG